MASGSDTMPNHNLVQQSDQAMCVQGGGESESVCFHFKNKPQFMASEPLFPPPPHKQHKVYGQLTRRH